LFVDFITETPLVVVLIFVRWWILLELKVLLKIPMKAEMGYKQATVRYKIHQAQLFNIIIYFPVFRWYYSNSSSWCWNWYADEIYWGSK
jgi:hypothetical protein